MLVVLLARGLSLPGAMNGLKFYLYPDPSRLVDPQVSNEDQTFSSIASHRGPKAEKPYEPQFAVVNPCSRQ